jgi:two-component system sensor histidine kinase PilS (NtrC family)
MFGQIRKQPELTAAARVKNLFRSLSLRDSFPPDPVEDDRNDSVNTFRSRLVWLSWIRLAMLIALAISTVAFSVTGQDSMLDEMRGFLMWFTIISIVPSSLYFPILLAVRSKNALRSVAVVQIIQDSAFAAVMVTTTGGSGSGFTFFFPLMIIVAGLVLQKTGAFIGILISSLFLLVISLWETGLMTPPEVLGVFLNRGAFDDVFYAYAINLVAFIVVGVLSNFLMTQIRKSDIQKEAYRIDLADLRILHETIISSLDTGLITLSLEGTVVHLNRAAQQLLEVDLKSVRGLPLEKVLPELNGPIDEIEGEVDIVRSGADGEPRYFQLVVKPLLSSRWKMVGRLIRIEDVTDMRRMEAQRKEDERLATIGKLSAVVAHEIRNPLAAISASAQMVAMSPEVGSEDRKALQIVVKETDHLNEWISDLLDYARPKKGEAMDFDISEMIRHQVGFARRLDGVGEISIVSDIQPGVMIKGDAQRFGRVVLNILKNAVEALDGKGNIVVRLVPGVSKNQESLVGVPPPPVAVLTIWNDGPTIPEADLARIFDTFYTTKARGTGLGLSTVVQICNDYGARVSVTSSEAEGTEFRIEFPL